MNKQQKLEVIYEAMADKTLSEGCIVFNKVSGTDDIVGNICINCDDKLIEPDFDRLMEKDEYKIIGHPVRIGDVFDYINVSFFEKDLYWYRVSLSRLVARWDKPRLPIGDQSEECIDFVYSLITK